MKTFRFRNDGNSLTPALIIIAALAVSAIVFFVFTRPKLQQKAAQAPAASTPVIPSTSAPAAAAPTKPQLTPPAEPKAPMTASTNQAPQATNAAAGTKPSAQVVPPTSMSFAQPGDVAKQIARKIAAGEFADAAKMAASGDAAQEGAAKAVLEKITKELGFKIGPEDKIQVMGQAGEATRVAIPLIKPGETQPSLTMQLDVVRDPQTGWKISQFRLPKELNAAVASTASKPGEAAPPPASAPATAATRGAMETIVKGVPLFTVETNPDPLGIAHIFVQALLSQDYITARNFVDSDKVPNQKIAGLCIVFEEGGYELKAGKPLVMTIASETEAWVIAQVKSEKLQQATEFGLEMQRSPDKPWRIVGLNLSDLLGSFAKSAGKIGVPYTPLVKNPSGGESLALYFEYDSAELHPRAQKQLEIVSNMLKANASRKLRIAGHTDAKGTDDYNLSLSSKRALAVKLKLAALGVSPEQVVTVGLGKAEPISPNQRADGTDDPEGRSRNRRAEIFLDF